MIRGARIRYAKPHRHTIQKPALVDGHFESHANFCVELIDGPCGATARDRIELSFATKCPEDDIGRKAGIAGIQLSAFGRERFCGPCAALDGK